MIVISRHEKSVTLTFDIGIGWQIRFEYGRHCEMDAQLLMMRMQSLINSRIEDIRRESYNAGWKDKASKKKTKEQYFSGSIKY